MHTVTHMHAHTPEDSHTCITTPKIVVGDMPYLVVTLNTYV